MIFGGHNDLARELTKGQPKKLEEIQEALQKQPSSKTTIDRVPWNLEAGGTEQVQGLWSV
jgi:hypothetical protein